MIGYFEKKIANAHNISHKDDDFRDKLCSVVFNSLVDAYGELYQQYGDIVTYDILSFADSINIGTASENAIARQAIHKLLDHMQVYVNVEGEHINFKSEDVDV